MKPIITETAHYFIEMCVGENVWETIAEANTQEEFEEYCSNGVNFRLREEITVIEERTTITYKDL